MISPERKIFQNFIFQMRQADPPVLHNACHVVRMHMVHIWIEIRVFDQSSRPWTVRGTIQNIPQLIRVSNGEKKRNVRIVQRAQNRVGEKATGGCNFTLRFHRRIIHEIRFPSVSLVVPIMTHDVCLSLKETWKKIGKKKTRHYP